MFFSYNIKFELYQYYTNFYIKFYSYMKELNVIKYINFKRKIQKELKNRISPILFKYNLFETFELKNNYLDKYHEYEKIINLNKLH